MMANMVLPRFGVQRPFRGIILPHFLKGILPLHGVTEATREGRKTSSIIVPHNYSH